MGSICFISLVPDALPASGYGDGDGPILLDNLNCSGDEESLKDCPHDGVGQHSCTRQEIAGVVCLNYGKFKPAYKLGKVCSSCI